jgi:hypothetical protein
MLAGIEGRGKAVAEEIKPIKRSRGFGVVVRVISTVTFVGTVVALLKNIDTIKKVSAESWSWVFSKPEVNFRDVRIDVTEYFPDTYGKPKTNYKTYYFFVNVSAVMEKKSVGPIDNCKGELKTRIDTRYIVAPEAKLLHWGQYDQPAKFVFSNIESPIDMTDWDFRILCDGVVSGWTSKSAVKR